MPFRIPPPAEATHHASLYGVPCYFGSPYGEEDGGFLCGTNVFADWLLLHYCPRVQSAVAALSFLRQSLGIDGPTQQGFPIALKGPIERMGE